LRLDVADGLSQILHPWTQGAVFSPRRQKIITRQPFLRYPQPACFAPERGSSDSLHAQNLRRGQDEKQPDESVFMPPC
jgi:hypothetical protein